MARLLHAIDGVNQTHPWSHNDAYSWNVMCHANQTLREGGTTALDVGCGTGNLLGQLAQLFPHVVGMEADPATAALAASAVSPWSAATVINETFPADSQRYDFVSMVAVLHHLPLGRGIEAARAAVAPGGRLAIVGVYREERTDALFSIISLVINPIIGLVRHPRRAARLPESMAAPAVPATDSYRLIRQALHAALPGVKVRRGLFWRYIATWHADQ
jgi:2-polyprenyl-3-methyl-5-hydroxy-6-metoxy-1,4-benzoquinol methylase